MLEKDFGVWGEGDGGERRYGIFLIFGGCEGGGVKGEGRSKSGSGETELG